MADLTEAQREVIKMVTERPNELDLAMWFDQACKEYSLTKQMAGIDFAPYDPQPERILRLIYALRTPEPVAAVQSGETDVSP